MIDRQVPADGGSDHAARDDPVRGLGGGDGEVLHEVLDAGAG